MPVELVSLYRAAKLTGRDPVLLVHWVKRGKLVPRARVQRGSRTVTLTTVADVEAAAIDRRDLARAAERRARAVELYTAPDEPSLADVAAELDVSTIRVQQYLVQAGFERRSRGAGAARSRARKLDEDLKQPGELDSKEFAALVGRSRFTVARLARLGIVTARRVEGDGWHGEHGTWLFPPEAVEEAKAAIAESAERRLLSLLRGALKRRRPDGMHWVRKARDDHPGWFRQIVRGRNGARDGGSGPKPKYTDEQAERARDLLDEGKSIRQTAYIAGLTKRQVEGLRAHAKG